MGRTMKSMGYGDVNKTAVIECRCDIRSLAAIYLFLTDNGFVMKSKSDIVRSTVDAFYQLLIDNKLAQPMEDFDDAMAILSPFGVKGRDRRAEMHISAICNRMNITDDKGVSEAELQRNVAMLMEHLENRKKEAESETMSEAVSTTGS